MSAEVLTTPRLVPLLALLAVGSLPAQITYVDASTSTNTTLANGAPYTPASANAAIMARAGPMPPGRGAVMW